METTQFTVPVAPPRQNIRFEGAFRDAVSIKYKVGGEDMRLAFSMRIHLSRFHQCDLALLAIQGLANGLVSKIVQSYDTAQESFNEEDHAYRLKVNIGLSRGNSAEKARNHIKSFLAEVDRAVPALPEGFYLVNLPPLDFFPGEEDTDPATDLTL